MPPEDGSVGAELPELYRGQPRLQSAQESDSFRDQSMASNNASEGRSREMRLKNGRTLGFAEFGDPAGRPFLYCHGWPSSRLEPAAMGAGLKGLGVRLIAPDRPGYGLSDLNPGRKIQDWVNDACELMTYLGINRFGVLGVSGGGPFSMACAWRIPERVSSLVLVCALGPVDAPEATQGMVALNRWLLSLARNAPWVAEKIATTCLRLLWRKGEQVIPKQIESRLPEADRRVLANPELRQALIASAREALRQGPQGAATDGLLYARPWEFDLRAIGVPVHLWHGEQDIVVPPSMGHYLAGVLPNCKAHFSQEDGHFSLPYGRMPDILAAV